MADFQPKPFGKYFLIEKLAVGGMAEIYKAKTYGAEGFEKLLAIKRILPHAAEDKDFIHMLIDEAKLSVMLSHANIVQVYDLGKVESDYFISMEFIHGVNLRDILYRLREQEKKIPLELAVYIASEVCKGLDYAHRKTDDNNQRLDIVHRDISPQNILLSYEGEVKIVDFGIAKAAMNISHTLAGILKGKIAYMSPEQAMGKSIDSRTDIFSLGIILYESLTGQKLYTGESQFEVLKKIRTTRIDIAHLPASVPTALKPILAKALAFHPEERYQSAGDMQVALTKFLYASFTDFSPRRLAGFIQALFQEKLKKEKGEEKGLEPQTSSVTVLPTKPQETIVHRATESSFPGRMGPADVTKEAMVFTSQTNTSTFQVATMAKRVLVSLGVVALLGAGGWLLLKTFGESGKGSLKPIATIQVTSEPAGAEITLNGQATDYTTPAILDGLEPKRSYRIGLKLEDYGSQERKVFIQNEEPYFLDFVLTKALGTLNVASDPPGAEVVLNGVATGLVTPTTLTDLKLNAEYRITLAKEEFKNFEQPITLVTTTPQTLSAQLQPIQVVQTGVLLVETEPNGAAIFLNGADTGKVTPATIGDLEIGKAIVLRLEKQDFEKLEKTFTLSGTDPFVVREKLASNKKAPEKKPEPKPEPKSEPKPEPVAKPKPQPPSKPIEKVEEEPKEKPVSLPPPRVAKGPGGSGTLQVQSKPDGADVFINGVHRGNTPLILKTDAGTFKVVVAKESSLPCQKMVDLKANKIETVSCTLGPLYGKIEINSSPPRAFVYLDGKKLGGKTPVTIKNVKRDLDHTLRIELDGFSPWEKTFNMRDGETKSFQVDLKK